MSKCLFYWHDYNTKHLNGSNYNAFDSTSAINTKVTPTLKLII